MNITHKMNRKGDKAQIVIKQPNPAKKGQQISETRHLQNNGGRWTDTHGNIFVLQGNSFKVAE